MKNKRLIGLILVGIFLGAYASLLAGEGGKPRTFLVRLEHLVLAKKQWEAGNQVMKYSMKSLIRHADRALKHGPYSVTQKKYLPPGGDPHDFLAYGSYYWPNPDTKNGQPWILRDGFHNPAAAMDWKRINPMSESVETLSLAYYFTGNEAYARHAALLLRTWFIDKTTRMNPNVNYGKVIPGIREKGYAVAGFGYVFRRVYDAAGILEGSPSWTDTDKKALQQWTRDFIKWVDTSPYGQEERRARNNHGTFFDMIMTVQSLYIGDSDRARETLLQFINKRIPKQFAADGTQPFEMKRANNYDYHRVNLMIAFDIAQLADHFDDIDVWNYKTAAGAGLRKAAEFLIPFLSEKKKWPYFTGRSFDISRHRRWSLLRRAAVGFADENLEAAADSIPGYKDVPIINLTYPREAIKTTPIEENPLPFPFPAILILNFFAGRFHVCMHRARILRIPLGVHPQENTKN
jgi:hypothetical protein